MKFKRQNKKKVYVSYIGNNYASWMTDYKVTNNREECDLLLLSGGEDINHKLYRPDIKTSRHYNDRRDIIEKNDYEFAKENKIPIWGTCRGIQMITALEGGKLIYDMNHNSNNHVINTFDGKLIGTNTLHHQMCYPFNLDESKYRILGWLPKWYGRPYRNPNYERITLIHKNFVEPEILWYPEANAMGTQWHPEMMGKFSNAVIYIQDIFRMFIEGSLMEYYKHNAESLKEETEELIYKNKYVKDPLSISSKEYQNKESSLPNREEIKNPLVPALQSASDMKPIQWIKPVPLMSNIM